MMFLCRPCFQNLAKLKSISSKLNHEFFDESKKHEPISEVEKRKESAQHLSKLNLREPLSHVSPQKLSRLGHHGFE